MIIVSTLPSNSNTPSNTSLLATYSLLRSPKSKLPSSLTVKELVGDKSLDAFVELSSIDYLLYSIRKFKKLPTKFDHPASVDISELQSLSPILLNAADRNVKSARKKLLSTLLTIFQPKKDELLKDWLESGKRWNEGERLPVKTHTKHEASHHDCLSDESASIIRHMLFTHGMTPSKIPSLMNEFSALLLGRPFIMNFHHIKLLSAE